MSNFNPNSEMFGKKQKNLISVHFRFDEVTKPLLPSSSSPPHITPTNKIYQPSIIIIIIIIAITIHPSNHSPINIQQRNRERGKPINDIDGMRIKVVCIFYIYLYKETCGEGMFDLVSLMFGHWFCT